MKLKNQIDAKKREAEEKRLKEREALLKSKEFAAQQREQARKNAEAKKNKSKKKEERESKPNPEALVRTHAVTFKQAVDIKAPIDEADSQSEYSHKVEAPKETEEQAATRLEYERRNNFISMYKRIDQSTLSEIGLKSKASLGEDAVEDIHGFSMLQRFRGDRDLNAFDRSKPIVQEESESDDEGEEEDDTCENINLRNINPEQKPSTALAAARDQKKAAKMIQIKEEKVPEFKWWVGGDPNAAERHA